MPHLLDAGLFYATWFACVLGAASGWPGAGVAVAAAALSIHVYFAERRSHEIALACGAGAFGFVVDTVQASAGVFSFPTASSTFCPLWLVAIWMGFATTLNSSMSWLQDRYLVAALLGAICGPLSYAYGARLGAMTITSPYFTWTLAIVWAIALPALVFFNADLSRRATSPT